MTTALELGVKYSTGGKLKQPDQRARLNSEGVKGIQALAKTRGIVLEEGIFEGHESEGFTPGETRSTAQIQIYNSNYDLIGLPIDLKKDDYFLPAKPPIEVNFNTYCSQHPELTFAHFIQETIDGKVQGRINYEQWLRIKFLAEFGSEYLSYTGRQVIKHIKAQKSGAPRPISGNFYDWVEDVRGIELTPDEKEFRVLAKGTLKKS